MELIDDLKYRLVYIDDILIIQKEGESKTNHIKKIEQLLKRLKEKNKTIQ